MNGDQVRNREVLLKSYNSERRMTMIKMCRSTFLLVLTTLVTAVLAQPAPIPRAVVPADAAPEALAPLFRELGQGESSVSIEGAVWLQLKFDDFQLEGGTLTISDEQGQSQTFTQSQLAAWEGLTAIFNGSQLTVTLDAGESGEVSATIGDIIIGLPQQGTEEGLLSVPQGLRDLLGDDFSRYIPDDLPREPGGNESGISIEGVQESICGSNDNRTASNHALSGRIMPIGCTGWIINGGAFLTAGHCIRSTTQIVEFNVPASLADGTTVAPAVRDQYRIVEDSIVSGFTGVGNDWAVFRVLPNTETGLMPMAAQGGAFQLSNTEDPSNVRITGYGVDGPAPNFGSPPPRNADNQTLQTHPGALTDHTVGGPNSATLRYTVDTQGGNSGSPVIVEGGSDVAIGIHTNGGCSASGGSNAGTSFRNAGLWAAVSGFMGADDIIWQNISGRVHYWSMSDGQRTGGFNVSTPVGRAWTLAGVGDVTGDGTDDIIWQNISGQVHYWSMSDGQRTGGFNVSTPVGRAWTLAGVNWRRNWRRHDDDIIWQNIDGTDAVRFITGR